MNQDIFQSGQNFSLALKKIKHEQFQTMFHFENVFLLCCRNGKISMRNFFILRSIVISSAFSLFSSFSHSLSLSLTLAHAHYLTHLHMHTLSHTYFLSLFLSLSLSLAQCLSQSPCVVCLIQQSVIHQTTSDAHRYIREAVVSCPNQQVRGDFKKLINSAPAPG